MEALEAPKNQGDGATVIHQSNDSNSAFIKKRTGTDGTDKSAQNPSNLIKAIRQAIKETEGGKFTKDRQLRFLKFMESTNLAKSSDGLANWGDDEWEKFFEVFETLATDDDL